MSRAQRIAEAVSRHIWETVEVRERETDPWVPFRGQVRNGATVQNFDGMDAKQIVTDAEVHLLAGDFSDLPQVGWQVRSADQRRWRLGEPARTKDAGGQVIWAPVKPVKVSA